MSREDFFCNFFLIMLVLYCFCLRIFIYFMIKSRLPTGKLLLFTFPLVFFVISTVVLMGSCLFVLFNPLNVIRIEQRIVPQVYGVFSANPPVYSSSYESLIYGDARPLIVKRYLSARKSPLAPYAKVLVDTADKYGVDWRLPIAIAGAESTFGRTYPPGSYNFWGYGIHERGTKHFSSFEEGIERVTRYLKEEYYEQGLVTPEQIMTKYCPLSIDKGGSWAKTVSYFMQELSTF